MIYLDHAATSLPRWPEAVQRAAAAAELPTPGRGHHHLQAGATEEMEKARRAVREVVGFGVVCFTSGATAALNQALLGLRPRPRTVGLDPLAHNALRRPAAELVRRGARCFVLPHDPNGRIDVDRLGAEWPPETDVLALTHGSNVTGLLQPVADVVEIAHKRGAKVLVDCAQTAGLLAPLADHVGPADAVAFSAHKGLRGLPGCGALALQPDLELEPLVSGGTGHDAEADTMPAEYPARLEAGTPNLPGIVAMGEAARLTLARPWPWRDLGAHLREALRSAGAVLVGEGKLPVVSFMVEGLRTQGIEEVLDRVYDVVVRAGLHCAPQAHAVLGTLEDGTVRVSGGAATTVEDVTALCHAVCDVVRYHRHGNQVS